MYRYAIVGTILFGLAIFVAGCGGGDHPYFVAGEEIQLNEATALAKIAADPRAFDGETVLVEGTIVQVCQGAGCWARVVTAEQGDTLFVKSVGDKVLLPKTCSGNRIRVEGPVVIVEPEPMEAMHDEAADAEGAESMDEVAQEGVEKMAETADRAGEEVVEVAQAAAGEGEELMEEECGGVCPNPQFFVSMDAVQLYR